MRSRVEQQSQGWGGDEYASYDDAGYTGAGQGYGAAYDDDGYDEGYDDDREMGLVLQTEQSLVGVSTTVTHHGVPLMSYTRTMSRFYQNRKQILSLGRHKCEVCGDRIRWLAWQTDTGNRTHDGCYERLAWMWTNMYAQQQRLANEGRLD